MAFVYTRELTDEEIAILEFRLADVKQWIDDAIDGQIDHCKSAIIKKELEETRPEAIVAQHLSKPTYRSQKDREKKDNGNTQTPV